jgi:hypothetical protein
MTFDEFKEKVTTIVSQPDTALASIGALIDEVKEDYEALNSTTEALKKAEDRIRDLQDTNQKLFLKQVGNTAPDEEDQKKDIEDMSLDEYLAECAKENEEEKK